MDSCLTYTRRRVCAIEPRLRFDPKVTLPYFAKTPRLILIMDTSPLLATGRDSLGNAAAGADPRLQPTPDYGTLGPGSDVAGYGQSPSQSSPRKATPKIFHIIAAVAGILAALLANSVKHVHSPHSGVLNSDSTQTATTRQRADANELDQMYPQKQAETLLQQAVSHSPGAVEQISSRVEQWNGKVQWNTQIANLSTAALNSDDLRVRESGVEVELAAYGLAENSQSVDYLLKTVDSPDHAQKIWALWALGLEANRGVDSTQIVEVLISHLSDSDADSRHWAVESLALSGTDAAIAPLLKAMHDDVSPLVRERAACGLAESGLFTPEQRATAVPQLIEYSDDPALDAPTHAWAIHALSDITHQRFGNDSGAWRNWYEKQVVSGQ